MTSASHPRSTNTNHWTGTILTFTVFTHTRVNCKTQSHQPCKHCEIYKLKLGTAINCLLSYITPLLSNCDWIFFCKLFFSSGSSLVRIQDDLAGFPSRHSCAWAANRLETDSVLVLIVLVVHSRCHLLPVCLLQHQWSNAGSPGSGWDMLLYNTINMYLPDWSQLDFTAVTLWPPKKHVWPLSLSCWRLCTITLPEMD